MVDGLLWVVRRTSASCEQRSRRSARSRGLAGVGQPGLDAACVTDAAADVDPELLQRLVWVDPVHDQPIPSGHQGEQFTLPRESLIDPARRQVPCPGSRAAGPRVCRNPAGHFLVGTGRRCALCPELTTARRPRVAPCAGVSRRNLADRAERMSVPTDDLMAGWSWRRLRVSHRWRGGSCLQATSAAAAWLPRHRPTWAALIAAWLDSDRPLRACCPDELGVLTTASTPKTAHHRAHILQVWPTQTAIDAEGLAETVAWRRPRMHRAAEQAPDVFGEATLLGLVEGAVATAALGLLESLEQAATTLPQAVGDASLIIQPTTR